jgi:hypothetical protein
MTDIEQAEVAVKNAQNQLDEARKRLEAAKTPRLRTVGEQIAEKMVMLDGDGTDPRCFAINFSSFTRTASASGVTRDSASLAREHIATAINHAIADEREACAKAVEGRKCDYGLRGEPLAHVCAERVYAAQTIRNRK